MSRMRRWPSDQPVESAGTAAERSATEALFCDCCGRRIKGRPAARGLFLWSRGEEVRYEEPPLCVRCISPARYGQLAPDADE